MNPPSERFTETRVHRPLRARRCGVRTWPEPLCNPSGSLTHGGLSSSRPQGRAPHPTPHPTPRPHCSGSPRTTRGKTALSPPGGPGALVGSLWGEARFLGAPFRSGLQGRPPPCSWGALFEPGSMNPSASSASSSRARGLFWACENAGRSGKAGSGSAPRGAGAAGACAASVDASVGLSPSPPTRHPAEPSVLPSSAPGLLSQCLLVFGAHLPSLLGGLADIILLFFWLLRTFKNVL